uniref:Uncharacterized protein n=1 Tax=Ciona savignyi TaxID=51511 RepID=H2YLF7_CIOSA
LKDQTVVEGKKATFECLINRDDGKAVWYAGNNVISGQDKKYKTLAMKNLRRLIVSDCTMDDKMTYTCAIEQESVELKPIAGLEFVSTLKKQKVKKGVSVKLECELSHPDVPVLWFKNKERIYESNACQMIVNGTKHSLEIVSLEDKVTVKCQAVPNPDVITTCTGMHVVIQNLVIMIFSISNQFFFTVEVVESKQHAVGILECEISRADASVRWLFNGEEIDITEGKHTTDSNGRKRTLVIDDLSKNDEGTYKCETDDGHSSTTAVVNVEVKDVKLLKGLRDASVLEGESATFEAEISDERVNCQWLLDGKVIEACENVVIEAVGRTRSITIKETNASHRGQVMPIHFIEQLKDQVAEERGQAKFACKISRVDANVKWIRDRRTAILDGDKYEIQSEGTTHTLIVKDASYEDEVTFTCDAEDAKSTAKLTVTARLVEFVEPLKDQTVQEGGRATFTCVLNHDDVEVTWYKRGVKLRKGRDVIIESDGPKHIIKFEVVSVDDVGTISISAEGTQGAAELTVATTEVQIVQRLEEQSVIEGDSATLTCLLNKPNVIGSWFRNGVKLARTDLIVIRAEAEKHTLVVKNLTVDDAAEFEFTCDGCQSVANVIVKERPIMFTKKLQPLTCTEMDVAELSCEVSRAHGEVTWWKGDEQVLPSDHIELINESCWRRLVILKTEYNDEAEYTCKCEADTTSAVLTVGGRNIKIRRDLRDVEATEGQSVTFECEISHDDVKVRWYLNGEHIKECEGFRFENVGRKHRMIIDNVSAASAGSIKFVASKASTEAELTVMEPLVEFVTPIHDLVVEEKAKAVFECEVSRPNAEVRWFKGRAIIRDSEKYEIRAEGCKRTLVVLQCSFDDEKKYTCDADDARTSAKLTVQARAIKFLKPLEQKIRVTEREEVVFEIELSHTDVEVIWYKNGAKMARTKNVELYTDGAVDGIIRRLILIDASIEDNAEWTCDGKDSKTVCNLIVKELDIKFLKNLKTTAVTESEDIKLDCEINTSKPVEVQWLHFGKPVTDSKKFVIKRNGGKMELEIKHTTVRDDGHYTCSVRGVKSEARITVKQQKNKIAVQLENVNAVEQQPTITFTCSLERETGDVKWLKDNKPIDVCSAKYEAISTGKGRSLLVKDIKKSDKGKYMCVCGDSKSTAELAVKDGVKFLKPLSDVNVLEKDGAVLQCEISDPDVKVRWYKNGLPITNSDRVTIEANRKIHSVSLPWTLCSDTGSYQVVAEFAKSDAKLTMHHLLFLKPLADASVEHLETATFSCKVSPRDQEVTWYLGENIISASERFLFSDDDKIRTLTIHQCTEHDRNNVTCCFADQKTVAVLQVGDPPAWFEIELEALVCTEREVISMQCELSRPNVDVEWMRDGKLLQQSNRMQFISEGVVRKIEVAEVTMEESGDYTVRVKDTDTTTTAHLTVNEIAPGILSEPDDVHCCVGDDITFTCGITKTRYNVTWTRDGKVLVEGPSVSMRNDGFVNYLEIKDCTLRDDHALITAQDTKHTLWITEFSEADRGRYTATCSGTAVETTAIIDVAVAPVLEIDVDDVTMKADSVIINHDDTKLRFRKPTINNSGRYKIVAKNKYGEDSAYITVTVIGKRTVPLPPVCLTVSNVTAQSAVLTWEEPEEDGGSPIVSFLVEKRDVKRKMWQTVSDEVEDTEITVQKLVEGNTYLFRVSCENKVGLSQPAEISNPVLAKSQFELSEAPQSVILSEVRRDHAIVSWKAPSFNGGSPITLYIVELRDKLHTTWTRCGVIEADILQCAVSEPEITAGKEYVFRVFAETAAGSGKPSVPTPLTKLEDPIVLPSSPLNLRYENCTKSSIELCWETPMSDGGAPITGYVIEVCDKSEDEGLWTAEGFIDKVTGLHFVVCGLEESHEYSYRIRAVNKVGEGKPSDATPFVLAKDETKMPAYDIADDKREIVVVEPEPIRISVPISGLPAPTITWVRNRDGQVLCHSEDRVKIDSGSTYANVAILPSNRQQDSGEYKLVLQNNQGTIECDFNVTVYNRPGVPTDFAASEITRSTCQLTWKEPQDDGGSEILFYSLERREAGRKTWTLVVADVRKPTWKVTELIHRNEYNFRVTAHNKVGAGKPVELASDIMAVDPLSAPTAPEELTYSEPKAKSIILSWKRPTSDGGCAITGYIVEMKASDEDRWNVVVRDHESTSVKVLGQTEGKEYTYRVAAVNRIGIGQRSETPDLIVAKDPLAAPSIEIPQIIRKGLETRAGKEILIEATYTGVPKPVITWIQQDIMDKTVEEDKARSSTLTASDGITKYSVPGAKRSDKGTYLITAENDQGKATASVVVNVLDVPSPCKGPWSFEDGTNEAVTLRWKIPEDDGGSDIINYVVDMKESNKKVWTKLSTTLQSSKYRATKLVENKEYIFRVCAENKMGKSPWIEAAPYVAKLPFDPPAAPEKPVVVDVTRKSMTVKWAEPYDGGSTITGYCLERKDTTASRWSRASREMIRAVEYVVTTGLTDGLTYQFRVAAENEAGQSKFSQPSDYKVCEDPVFAPSSPRKPRVEDTTSSSITLAWDRPEGDGGDAKLKYIIEQRLSDGSWSRCNDKDLDATTFTVENLQDGNLYLFRIKSINRGGESSPASLPEVAALLCAEPLVVPGRPENLRIEEKKDTSIALHWVTPRFDDNGGADLMNYVVEKREGKNKNWTQMSSTVIDTKFRVTKLTAGMEYQFRVAGENKFGVGHFAETEKVIAKNPYDIPGPPYKPTVTEVTKESMLVTWQPPSSDGGAVISKYILEKRSRTKKKWSKATSDEIGGNQYRVRGLREGQEYMFRVAAVNAAGQSEFSAPSDLILASAVVSPPGPPFPSVKDITKSAVSLAWKVPDTDGGSKIKGYHVEMQEGDSEEWIKATKHDQRSCEFVVPDLPQGKKYNFRVMALNAAGQGEPGYIAEPVIIQEKQEMPEISLNVSVKEKIVVKAGGVINIPLYVTGRPSPTVSWEKDNKELPEEARVGEAGGSRDLVIRNCTREHSGKYTVIAKNDAGEKRLDIEVLVQDVPGVCGGPINPSNVTRDTIGFSWSPPEDDGGCTITNYVLEKRESSRRSWTRVSMTVTRTSAVVQGLIEGESYMFRVSAENILGVGPGIETMIPITARDPVSEPGRTEELRVTDVTRSTVSLAWKPPKSDGGLPISEYLVEKRLVGQERQLLATDKMVRDTEVTLEGFSEGDNYEFRVIAKNERGTGPPSFPTKPVVCRNTIEPPTLKIDAREKMIVRVGEPYRILATISGKPAPTVTWEQDGKLVQTDSRFQIKTTPTTSALEVHKGERKDSGLYKVTVQNDGGQRDGKIILAVVNKPTPPRDLDVKEVTHEHVLLTWEAPEDDGGSELLNYVIEKRDISRMMWTTVNSTSLKTEFRISKLSEGSEYVFRVMAENNQGCSNPAETQGVVVKDRYRVPDAPDALTIKEVHKDSVGLSWNKPYDGGKAIFNYVVEKREIKSERWVRVTKELINESRYTVTGLFESNEYEFRVAAENSIGIGAKCLPSKQVKAEDPVLVPGPAVNPQVKSISKNTVTVTWQKPRHDGGAPVLGYIVETQKAGSEAWKIWCTQETQKTTSYTVPDLTENYEYRIRVTAVNKAAGESRPDHTVPVAPRQKLSSPSIEIDVKTLEGLTVRAGSTLRIPATIHGI